MFEQRDLIFAFTLHILMVLVIFGLNLWHIEHKPKLERSIKVQMVSLQELQAMMPKAQDKIGGAKPKQADKKSLKKKQKPKPKKKSKPKAVLSPKPQPKQKRKVVEEDPDYDPFAPLESSSKSRGSKQFKAEKVLKELLKKQLSKEALDRYIVAMQKAVENKWKVPTEMIDRVSDALVELKLYRNGKVASIKILESSGSKQLDQTLTQAIYAAAPFDIPQQQFELFKTNTIRFYPLK